MPSIHRILSIVILAGWLAVLDGGELPVVPAVREWLPGSGVFAARNADIVVDAAGRERIAGVARLFNEDLQALGLGTRTIRFAAQAQAGHFFLTLDGGTHPEGYGIDVGAGTTIHAGTPVGLFYGTRAVLQILGADPVACTLPQGRVADHPAYQRRMLMLDVGRKPFPVAVLKDYLRMLGWFRMNELHLHLSDEAFGGDYAAFRVQCDTFPGLTSKDLFYTRAQLRELQDFAKERGITITPEFDMPGHARCFTNLWPECMLRSAKKSYPNYLDVTNPRTITNLKAVLDEMIPLFDASDIHIGTDEYRTGDHPDKDALHEAFRRFINTMNAHIRSRGRNCRIWSGFEHMGGTTDIDPGVIIDMWETDDARSQIAKGHAIINSNHGRTYIVPGCHYYGVSNAGIYDSWEPWMVSGTMAKNPARDEPRLLGGKLHVWSDQGPTGYTMTEIALLTRPSLQAFGEKMWGTRGSATYPLFTVRAAATDRVPGVTVFDRLDGTGPSDAVLALEQEQDLGSPDAHVDLPLATAERADLEYPWTLTMQVRKTAETGRRGVILSSGLVEVCADFSSSRTEKSKGADGKEVKTSVVRTGIGLVRAAGSTTASPAESQQMKDVSEVCAPALALNTWTTISVVGERGRTTVYVDGVKSGTTGNQMVCPLRWLGSRHGQSFVGQVRRLSVIRRASSAKEIARAAGLDVPESLCGQCPVTASRTDGAFLAAHITDGDPATRWSSGGGREATVVIDLKTAQPFNQVRIAWEHAFARSYSLAVSSDGQAWQEVHQGAGKDGDSIAAFPLVTARFVRITGKEPASAWGYSIWEAEVLRTR